MNVTERFSNLVENYIKYRPSYPPEVIELLQQHCSLRPGTSIVADIGSGTGILSELLLKAGFEVYAVEPNEPMRLAAEKLLAGFPSFRSSAGTAEQMPLNDHSVDLITAAQAFHWFKRGAARQEFSRVLKPGGWVALMWNDRRVDSTPFLRDYERLLLEFGTDYETVNHRNIDETIIGDFFSPGRFQAKSFFNQQLFDFDGVKGRLLSSSYVPKEGHPQFEPMLAALRQIFEQHQENGQVAFEYDTIVYIGRFS